MKEKVLQALRRSPSFDDIDIHVARFLADQAGCDQGLVALTAALLSRELSLGHSCLEMKTFAGKTVDADDPFLGDFPLPLPESWEERLCQAGIAGKCRGNYPLMAERGRLYLHRYWDYERTIASELMARASVTGRTVTGEETAMLNGLFPDDGAGNLQLEAARMVLSGKLGIISGGPGTGKTTTVARILYMLLRETPDLSVALAAPTGKAAARMVEAIDSARGRLMSREDGTGRGIPDPAIEAFSTIGGTTLHRLLGPRPGSVHFRHNRENPLHHDAVIIDEASMIDSALMAKVLVALKPGARLILLGDRDQLASVEAGAVLADICESAIERKGALQDHVVQLSRSWRFEKMKGIGALSAAVRSGLNGTALMKVFDDHGPGEGINFIDLPADASLRSLIKERLIEGYAPYTREEDRAGAIARFGDFRLLSPVRSGPWGVGHLNALVESVLEEKKVIRRDSLFYINRPIMITENDYNLGLFNGDTGIVREDEEGTRRVYFMSTETGQVRAVMPSLLPAHETVFAMTVHKSQGSEFDRVLFIIPGKDYPVISRELIYTAVTRARELVEVMANRDILSTGISRRVSRASGLADRLV